MGAIIEIFLTGLADPIIWIKTMSTLGCNKSRAKYYGAFWGYYLLLVGRELFSNYCNVQSVNAYARIILAVYIVASTFILFGENLHEKVIGVCIFFCVLFVSELVATEICMALTHKELDSLMCNRGLRLSCWGIIKSLQVMMYYLIFSSKKRVNYFYSNKEKISVIILLAIMLSNLLMKRYVDQLSINAILLFQMIEILLQWYVLSSLFVFKKKEKTIWELSQEVSCSLERKELVSDIERFKHNYALNGLIMKNLCYYKKYDELGKYMEEVFKDVEKAELLFNHSNIAIRILISGLIQMANDMKIPFSVQVPVEEFGMDDEDICSILQNLVKNALEAASKVSHYSKHVTLQVLDTDDGYEIRCINDCMGEVNFDKTSKQNKQMHGLGVGIVDKIVAEHYGTIQRKYEKAEDEKIGHVTVSIQFCL
nr:GHKL domain-containing protein [uncultured Lachnoclostridium sp.]